jgi:hypothetical protein
VATPSVTSHRPHRPRIRFEERPAAPVDSVPRMDVAAFVGFAETGPVHVPARVESFARFETIFGGEVPLAWDPVRGESVRALLRRAVRAFFDNGGEHCWVVRVAEPVEANAFPIPGVVSLASGASTGRAAFARARSQGRWSDGVKVGSALQAFPIGITAWSPGEGWIALAPTGERELDGWDLVRLRFDGATVEAMMFVGALQQGGPPSGDPVTRARAGDGGLIWLSSEPPGEALARVRVFGVRSWSPLPLAPGVEWQAGEARVPLAMRLDDAPVPGTVLALDLDGGGEPVWFTVTQIFPDPADDERIWLGGPIRRRVAPPSTMPAALPVVERLRLELWARAGDGQLVRAANLGFHPRHRRAWMALATDEELHGGYALAPTEEAPHGVITAAPRGGLAPASFPLAGEERGHASFPVGVLDVPIAFLGAEAPASARTPLERDGLDVYDERLFVDPALADARSGALLADAERIRDLGPAPRRLRGMHALLSVDEVTLIAIPDAVHPGWSQVEAADVPAPPTPTQVEAPAGAGFQRCRGPVPPAPVLTATVEGGVTTIRWGTAIAAGVAHELQASIEGDFEDAWIAYAGAGMERTFHGLPPGDHFFRARTTAGGETGPWSDIIVIRLGGGRSWRIERGDALGWRVNTATHRALLRMCAARGDVLAVLSIPRDTRDDDALRYAGELRGLLPARFPSPPTAPPSTEPPLIVPPLTVAERFVASYGALYHPWVFSRADAGAPPVAVPPAGAVTGAIASRARLRGAWVAPANQPLVGILGLMPISADRLTDLDAGAVNVLLDDPRGFLAMSEWTLSTDEDLHEIHVRRLLALLKRAALHFGERYVFEPHSPGFRRTVERAFRELLGRMYRGGAFAGASAAQGYQVLAGEAQNPPGSVEQGRFVIELRVAPAHALEFLTVRLVQSREGALAVEEA